MGLGGISIWQLLIILAIVVMVFGTSRLRSLGGDLGSAIKGFKSAMNEPEGSEAQQRTSDEPQNPQVLESSAEDRQAV